MCLFFLYLFQYIRSAALYAICAIFCFRFLVLSVFGFLVINCRVTRAGCASRERNIKTTKQKTIFELEIVIVHIVNRYTYIQCVYLAVWKMLQMRFVFLFVVSEKVRVISESRKHFRNAVKIVLRIELLLQSEGDKGGIELELKWMKREERLKWKCKRVDAEQEKNYKFVDLLKSN